MEHSRKALMARQKSSANRSAGIAVKRTALSAGVALGGASSTTARLMDDLAHYKVPKVDPEPAVKTEAGAEPQRLKPGILGKIKIRRFCNSIFVVIQTKFYDRFSSSQGNRISEK